MDKSRNLNYYTDLILNNCLSDFNGKQNTLNMCLKATSQQDWKTSVILNSFEKGYYPAACSCWRYHTVGTDQGEWYLPAAGEMGYLQVNIKKIWDTIKKLRLFF